MTRRKGDWLMLPMDVVCPHYYGQKPLRKEYIDHCECEKCGNINRVPIPLSEFYGRGLTKAHIWVRTK